jgi:UDP-N-acetylmuramoyl-L-alanyl-D-glutamate--2,6-diaminopimelate ligase
LQINFKKPLAELVQSSGIRPLNPLPAGEVWVSGIQLDSRKVTQAICLWLCLAAAVMGMRISALRRSAAQWPPLAFIRLKQSLVPFLIFRWKIRAVRWHGFQRGYDFPARSLTVIGVTGTDGKTTTSNFLYQIFWLPACVRNDLNGERDYRSGGAGYWVPRDHAGSA